MIGIILYDKLVHCFINILIIVLFGFMDLFSAVFMAFLISLAKELYDEYTYGGFDWYDILADIIGIIIGIIIVLCL